MSAENECVKLKVNKSLNKPSINLLKNETTTSRMAEQAASSVECHSPKTLSRTANNNEDYQEEEDKQMLGGCCVCGDDTGYSNNLLVYCDGVDCKVAVHQCCYGILNVPDDSWYCGSCKHKIELASIALKTKCWHGGQHLHDQFKKLTCELCPCPDGALKRTQCNKWAHVVCALYIPEISFGSVKTMEPIILKDIKCQRFDKKCSVCLNTDNSCTSQGVYVNCGYKDGCQEWFHVTCAQRKGLLCEESNTSYKNNLNYSIYCSLHLNMLLSQSTNCLKKLPPFNSSLCPVSNPSNKNNLGKSVSNLIHCVNQSLLSNAIVDDLSAFIEAREKEKLKEKLKLNAKKSSRDESVSKPRPSHVKNSKQKQPIIDLGEKKKKRFSFNNSSSLSQRSTIKQNNVNKAKLDSNKTDELDKTNISQDEFKSKEANLNEVKIFSGANIAKLEEAKTEVLTEQIDNEKNDECNSIKSFHSASTTSSCTSKRKSMSSGVDHESKKSSKTSKLDNDDSNDAPANNNPTLTINLEDAKLACHGGIVTPSTSSCASSTSSNFSKSPESLDIRAKCKHSLDNDKLVNDTQTQCIDAFGNFLNKQIGQIGQVGQIGQNCDNHSSEEERNERNNSLEEMLTKQWHLGASLCRNLSKKFDCMDLLDLLYKCKQDNLEMEKKLKLLEQNNLQNEQMNRKLSRSFNQADEAIPFRKLIQSVHEQTASASSFNKCINDHVQNLVTTNKSSFQPSANSLNYSNLIQQSLSYLHSKSPHLSPTTNNSSLLNLYNKQMQNQSPAQPNTLTHFQTTTWNPATSDLQSQTPTKSNPPPTPPSLPAQNNGNSSSLNSLLSQNQLLQSFQQLNPLQQQQIASYYYMAATTNPSQSIAPSTTTNYNS